jgi:hypothetical protein
LNRRVVLTAFVVGSVVVSAAGFVVASATGTPGAVDASAVPDQHGSISVTNEWRAASAGLTPGVDPTSAQPCQSGRPACVDAVIVEMRARLARHVCAHTAPFAFTYLEMTLGVQRRLKTETLFKHPEVLAHLDALFARLYFNAYDNWYAGRRAEVPGAWQAAFAAADGGQLSAGADLLLGMNAHISRDLAFAVASMIEAKPDAGVDATDFRSVNRVISEIRTQLLNAAAERFDPSLRDLERELAPTKRFDATALIALWRDQAFTSGRKLAHARGPERALVAAEIERNAVAGAVLIVNADRVFRRGLMERPRNEYCARMAARSVGR